MVLNNPTFQGSGSTGISGSPPKGSYVVKKSSGQVVYRKSSNGGYIDTDPSTGRVLESTTFVRGRGGRASAVIYDNVSGSEDKVATALQSGTAGDVLRAGRELTAKGGSATIQYSTAVKPFTPNTDVYARDLVQRNLLNTPQDIVSTGVQKVQDSVMLSSFSTNRMFIPRTVSSQESNTLQSSTRSNVGRVSDFRNSSIVQSTGKILEVPYNLVERGSETLKAYAGNYGVRLAQSTAPIRGFFLKDSSYDTEKIYGVASLGVTVGTLPRYTRDAPLFFSYLGGKTLRNESISTSEYFSAGAYLLPGALKLGEKGLSKISIPSLPAKFQEGSLALSRDVVLAKQGLGSVGRTALDVVKDVWNTKLTSFEPVFVQSGRELASSVVSLGRTESLFVARGTSIGLSKLSASIPSTMKVSEPLFLEIQKVTPSSYNTFYRGANDVYKGIVSSKNFLSSKVVAGGEFVKGLSIGSSIEYGVVGAGLYSTGVAYSKGQLDFEKDIVRPGVYGFAGLRDTSSFSAYFSTRGKTLVQASRLSSESLLKGTEGYGTYKAFGITQGNAPKEIDIFRSSKYVLNAEEFKLSQSKALYRGVTARPFTAGKYYIVPAGTSELTGGYYSIGVVPAFLKIPGRSSQSYSIGGLFSTATEPSIEVTSIKGFSTTSKTSLGLEQVQKDVEFLFPKSGFEVKTSYLSEQATLNELFGTGKVLVPRRKAELEFILTGASKEKASRYYTVIPSESTAQTRTFFTRYGRGEAFQRVPKFNDVLSNIKNFPAFVKTRTSNIFLGANYKPGQFYKYGFSRGEGFSVPISEREAVQLTAKSLSQELKSAILKDNSLSTSSSSINQELSSTRTLLYSTLRSSQKSVIGGGYSYNSSSSNRYSSNNYNYYSKISSTLYTKSSTSISSNKLSYSSSSGSSSITSYSGSSQSYNYGSSSKKSGSSTSYTYGGGTSYPFSYFGDSETKRKTYKSKRLKNINYPKISIKTKFTILPDLASVSYTESALFRKYGGGEATVPKATKGIIKQFNQSLKGYSSGYIPTEESRTRKIIY